MSKLTRAEVEHIARLARLALTEAETAQFQEQLSAILEYAGTLQQLDTEGVPPTTSALPLHTVMRPDEPRPGLSTEDALANAPDVADGSFRVQPVF